MTILLTAAISCPALPTDGLNGQITYSVDTPPPYNFGTIATYLCDTSYGVTGDSILTCGVGSVQLALGVAPLPLVNVS